MQKMESVRTTEMMEQIKSIEAVGADIIKNEVLDYNSQGILNITAVKEHEKKPTISSRTNKDMQFFN